MGDFFERIIVNAALALGVLGIIAFITNQNFKARYNKQDKFFENEMQADSARRREVEPEFFYFPNTNPLPFREDVTGNIAKKLSQSTREKQERWSIFWFAMSAYNKHLAINLHFGRQEKSWCQAQ